MIIQISVVRMSLPTPCLCLTTSMELSGKLSGQNLLREALKSDWSCKLGSSITICAPSQPSLSTSAWLLPYVTTTLSWETRFHLRIGYFYWSLILYGCMIVNTLLQTTLKKQLSQQFRNLRRSEVLRPKNLLECASSLDKSCYTTGPNDGEDELSYSRNSQQLTAELSKRYPRPDFVKCLLSTTQ